MKTINADVRKIAHESFTVHVQYKGLWLFKFGLWFIKLGCWISGINYVEDLDE